MVIYRRADHAADGTPWKSCETILEGLPHKQGRRHGKWAFFFFLSSFPRYGTTVCRLLSLMRDFFSRMLRFNQNLNLTRWQGKKKRAVIYKHELILAYWSFPHPLSLVTPTQLLYEMIGLVRIPILSHAYPVASDP